MQTTVVNQDVLISTTKIIVTSPFFQILLFLVALDILSGYTKAIKLKILDSRLSTSGLLRHVIVIATVFGVEVYSIIFGQRLFGQLVAIAFSGSYGISLLENLEALGVWIPPSLKQVFLQMKEREINVPHNDILKSDLNGKDRIIK